MTDPERIDTVGDIVEELRALGLAPVMVGGMALVVLGSRRVTRDIDFVVSRPDDRLAEMVAVLYKRGFELAGRVDEAGMVRATIDNQKVATIRLRIDAPDSAFFLHSKTELRVDLLFDFPVAAATLLERATRMRIRGRLFDIASERDLLHLKTLARADRSFAGDAQDIEFLESRLKGGG